MYDLGVSNASNFHNPTLRLVHCFIFRNLTCRGDANGAVNQSELYLLFNIANGRQINLALLVAYAIRRQVDDNRSITTYLNYYITKLLKAMRI